MSDTAHTSRPRASADAADRDDQSRSEEGARPETLVLGPIDSPRFAVPPFAPEAPPVGDQSPGSEGSDAPSPPVVGDAVPHDEDLSAPTEGDGLPSIEEGDGLEMAAIDALEAYIDTDAVDEAAARMAANESVESATNDRVVETLLRRGDVTETQARTAELQQTEKYPDAALWRVLAQLEDVDKQVVYERAARIYAFEAAALDDHPPNPDFVRSMMESLPEEKKDRLLDLGVVPHRDGRADPTTADKVCFITHDPMRPDVHRAVRALDLDRFELQYAPETEVNALIAELFERDNEYLERLQEESALDLGQSFEEEEDLVDQEKLEEEINRSTLINLFEATLVEAVREGASDIHIFPNADKEVEIHFRMNGRLNHWHTEDRVHPEALLSVVKDNSMNVDRFESDAAQDGFIQRDVDGTRIRFRVSIMPIASASQDIDSESVVIRVLDDRKVITDLDKLGLGPRALDRFEHAINQPYGMVILTGPTGSGKSTTLVAALHRVIGPGENVLTVEDPVEYIIEGARQIKLSDKLKLKDALRSILRHDPDTVMVGEMRDKETAELAIKLANTGHLTFSTLHTNDAPSAVSRLYKMDIEPFLIAYAINLVVAQRLIRTLCPNCKREMRDPDPVLLRQLGFTEDELAGHTLYEANKDAGCPECDGTGYDGRRAIAEALHFSREIRHMIVEADDMVDEGAIREHAEQEDGMRSLQASARRVVLNGETSVEEMMRVVAS